MRLSRLKIILLSLLLASVTLWITNQQSQTPTPKTNKQTTTLGYSWQASLTTVWNLSPSELDKQSILQAKSILYKDNAKISEYQQPRIELIDKENITTLTSNQGQSIEDMLFHFTGNVIVIQKQNASQSKSSNKTTLKTEHLNYNLHTNEMATDEKVVITQYNGVTSGTGLKANLKTSEFQLLSDVAGTYYPQKMQQTVQVKEP